MMAPTFISSFSGRLSEIYGAILTYCFADTTFLFFKVKAALIDIRHKGNCLREVYMDRFIRRYVLIELIRIFDRAVLYAGSTTRAFVLYDIPGLFGKRHLEVSRFPFYHCQLQYR